MIYIGKNKEYTQLLLRFSKENDMLQDVSDILAYKKVGVRGEINLESFSTIHQLLHFFDRILTWNYTEEGFNFWYKVHLKWFLFLKQHSSEQKEVFFENHCRRYEMINMYKMYRDEFEKISSNQLD